MGAREEMLGGLEGRGGKPVGVGEGLTEVPWAGSPFLQLLGAPREISSAVPISSQAECFPLPV